MAPELRARARVLVAGRPLMDLEPALARIAELGLEQTIEVRAHRHSEQEMAELFTLPIASSFRTGRSTRAASTFW